MEAKRGPGWMAFFGALTIAGGVSYFAFREHARGSALASDLDRARSEGRACTESLGGARAKSEGSDKELEDCRQAREGEKAKHDETEKLAQDTANNLSATRAELDELRELHAEADKRLAAFKTLGDKLRKMIDAGKLQVAIRRGRMIVKLPAEVLFASGSAQLSAEGHAPLKELAQVLRQFPDRRFMVAGHTDNVPIGPSNYKSNWELSTARAVTVTEFLASMGVSPARLAAAGYSEYDPIKPNGSEAGRAENRRIEIVLLPNVDEISGLAKQATLVSEKDKAAKPGK
jgi:chemotaxis protein MotB